MTKLDDFAPPGPQDGSYPSTRSSSLQSEDSQINKNNSTSSKNTSSMLSVDFASPLVGTARAERIKMMTSGHVSDTARNQDITPFHSSTFPDFSAK